MKTCSRSFDHALFNKDHLMFKKCRFNKNQKVYITKLVQSFSLTIAKFQYEFFYLLNYNILILLE